MASSSDREGCDYIIFNIVQCILNSSQMYMKNIVCLSVTYTVQGSRYKRYIGNIMTVILLAKKSSANWKSQEL